MCALRLVGTVCGVCLASVAAGRRLAAEQASAVERRSEVPPRQALVTGGLIGSLACALVDGLPAAAFGFDTRVGAFAPLHGRRGFTERLQDRSTACALKLARELRLSEGDEAKEVWQYRMVTKQVERDTAVKFFDADTHPESRVMREVSIMQRLSGPHFLQCFGAISTGRAYGVIMELGRDLQRSVMDQPFEVVDLIARVRLFLDLVQGLRELADQGFVHRNIRPQNLILVPGESDEVLKIGDFGDACSAPGGPEDFQLSAFEAQLPAGSVLYAPPESYDKVWTEKGDMYSAGLVLYELLFEGNIPRWYDAAQAEPSDQDYRAKWRSFDIKADSVFSAAKVAAFEAQNTWLWRLLSLLERMLSQDREDRIDAGEAAQEVLGLSAAQEGLGAQELLRKARLAGA